MVRKRTNFRIRLFIIIRYKQHPKNAQKIYKTKIKRGYQLLVKRKRTELSQSSATKNNKKDWKS